MFKACDSPVVALVPVAGLSQTLPQAPEPSEIRTPDQYVIAIARDQKSILTSPARIGKRDLLWLVPLASAVGTAFAFDKEALDKISTDPSRVEAFRRASNITGIYAPLATVGASWITGVIRHDDHLRETGTLAGAALIDTMLVTEMVKFGADRVRPKATGLSSESGEFWPDGKHAGGGDSFPSGHTAIAFAFAHVVADEYPNWQTKLAVYSLAAATGFERLGGREHFPSDVLVGGALGYLVGGYVFNHHSSASQRRLIVSPVTSGKSAGLFFSF
ncbi:MAG: phosphatase PAP2 family protein [Acidobacteria bacterium]|nr:phosphatase PAP2 family protein [Acidobacteriota bacterium]